ncbi:LLM class flavin-dependent oxidoreductase [Breoghania sp. JC706]|uniref:LLM class flavin-dependent oxidoreductase n=1 Tax=Breoghania sp. JC706 TaxID=3117732 RepID=UPI003009108E
MSSKRIHFGVMLQGAGVNMNAWRHPSVPPNASINFDFYVERARKAEAAGLDFVFIADGLYIHEKSFPHFLNRFEPVAILSALAAMTSKIGLVGTMSTSYSDPFTLARQFGSIDMISGGRAAWNAVTSPLEGSGRNYSRAHPDHALRYKIADEYLEVVTKLWDSWDDDAFIRDVETGRFMDPAKMHRLDHHGAFFDVEGPLNIARSPQGQPLIFQAGASDAGIELAAKYADCVFTNGGTLEKAQTFYRKVKDAARAHGRNPDHIKIFPGTGPVIGTTEEAAQERLREFGQLLTIEDALNYLSHFFQQHDFTVYPLDDPFPDLGDLGKDGFRSTSEEISRIARERGLTLREVAVETATLRAHIGTSETFTGSAERIAGEMIRWIDEGAADGFMLGFPVLGCGLDDFVDLVLPILAERGYHDMQTQGTTLRDHFGLPYRESVYAHPADPAAEEQVPAMAGR